MRPGVRVESGLLSPARSQLSSTSASSAGVLLRSASQGKRLTVANPKIPNPDDVYHPTTSLGGGTCIGRITERFEALGISLVELHPSIPFTNNEYFQAERPRRLVSSNDPAMTYGTWCTLDGMASGLVALHVSGLRAELAVRPPDAYADMTRFKIGSMFEYFSPGGGKVRDGICGAPIVADGASQGGEGGEVLGFFQVHPGDPESAWAFALCLGDLIDRGWEIVEVRVDSMF